jgi:EAL domain-containing protein (putative c-di-GMP-specific phosphodiesterase class I)
MSELREGIIQNEFEVYFQPKVNFTSGKVAQVEALARWHHPAKGFMPPNQFVPLAEETGHIKKLTLWLLEKSIEQCSQWYQNNLPIGVSVNLSVKDLLNKNLTTHIKELIKKYNIDPAWLTLEITESAFMHDPNSAIAAINKLSEIGVLFSIDDYGTGYSSLSYLRKIPVHELKIDQSFIQEITRLDRVNHIVRSTIELGHSLQISVVAEGVEDMDTYDLLKEMGCDLGQGYLFSHPISSKDFSQWLQRSRWGIGGK